jgi:hypothetical protein
MKLRSQEPGWKGIELEVGGAALRQAKGLGVGGKKKTNADLQISYWILAPFERLGRHYGKQ